jgi:hypothetical protein
VPCGAVAVMMPGRAVDLAASPVPQGVVDGQHDRDAGWDQRLGDEVQQDQAELVSRPAGGGKEAVGQVVVAASGKPAPTSIPVTVRRPGWVKNPATSAWKVGRVRPVKQGVKAASRVANVSGRLLASIGGCSFGRE